MSRFLSIYHGALFRFWYGKSTKLSYYHGKKFNRIQSLPVCEVSGGIQFRNYRNDFVLAAQSISIVATAVLFMVALVARYA